MGERAGVRLVAGGSARTVLVGAGLLGGRAGSSGAWVRAGTGGGPGGAGQGIELGGAPGLASGRRRAGERAIGSKSGAEPDTRGQGRYRTITVASWTSGEGSGGLWGGAGLL